QSFKMTIAITVNKRKTKDRPVESAFAQRFLCSDLAGWIVLLWFQLIVLAPRMRARFVDRAGAGKDKPRARCMRFHGGYQVQRSFQISLPDEIGVLGTKDSGQVNDVCYAVHRLGKR